MRLEVSFAELLGAVRRMGADQVKVDFDVGRQAVPLDPIDIELEKGIELDLSQVDSDNGLLSYQGRQVLLYIQDHGSNVQRALENGANGNRFHVAFCSTLEDMRSRGRFERYVATNDLGGEFYITGSEWQSGRGTEGHTSLKVCRNCLRSLNYQGFRRNRDAVFRRFSLTEFFSTYSSFFPYMPRRLAGEFDGGYTADWPDVAARYKASKAFVCESCKVNLSGQGRLLHVHHVDGVKTRNVASNLRALCADCHRKQAGHGHLHVPHEDTRRIATLRRDQGLVEIEGWDEAFELADPAVHGVLHLLKDMHSPIPEVGCEVEDRRGMVVAEMELAWPGRRLGIAIAEEDRVAALAVGWRAISVKEALEREW